MKAKFTLAAVILLVAGCARSNLHFKKKSLTGEEYCVARCHLLTLKNSASATLSLKYAKEDSGGKVPIKATLYIAQNGREYNINPHEMLKLYVNGVPYTLTVVNSFQEPLEVINHHSAYLPPGRTFRFGTVQEITTRHISFFLPQDYLSKMVNAKRIAFEISSSTSDRHALQGYPIFLEFSSEEITSLQEFKNKCVNNFLNQSGENK